MKQTIDDENLMTRYLLGELSEEEQMALEAEYFADPEKFDQLQSVENDLIEGYVNGKLSFADRTQFERRYLSSPARREQAQFFRVLAKAVPLETARPAPAQEPSRAAEPAPAHLAETTSWRQSLLAWFRGPKLAVGLSFAAATLVLVAGAMWLLNETLRLRQQLAQNERERAALQQREQELKRQIDTQRERNDQLAQELDSVQQKLESLSATARQPAPAMASFTWTLSGLRGSDAGAPRRLVIPPGAEFVRLTFKLPTARYSNYRIALQTLAGEEIWSRGEIKARPTKSGASVTLIAPAKEFKEGSYGLALSGIRATGEAVEIGEFHIEVDSK